MSQGLDLDPAQLHFDDMEGMDLQPAGAPRVPQQVRQTTIDDVPDTGEVQQLATASQALYRADTTIRPVPRPRPIPRSTVTKVPRQTSPI